MIYDVGDEIPDFNLDSQNGPIHFRDMVRLSFGKNPIRYLTVFGPSDRWKMVPLCHIWEFFRSSEHDRDWYAQQTGR